LAFFLGQEAEHSPTNSTFDFEHDTYLDTFQKYLFNKKAIEYSVRTITKNIAGKPRRLKENGSLGDTEKWFNRYSTKDPTKRELVIQNFAESYLTKKPFDKKIWSTLRKSKIYSMNVKLHISYLSTHFLKK